MGDAVAHNSLFGRLSARELERPAGLLDRLDRIVIRHGGRVYLAKDSSLSAWAIPEMYPDLTRFQEIQQKHDPNHRFSSSLARRLNLLGST